MSDGQGIVYADWMRAGEFARPTRTVRAEFTWDRTRDWCEDTRNRDDGQMRRLAAILERGR